MSTLPSSSLHLPNPLLLRPKSHAPPHLHSPPRATPTDSSQPEPDPKPAPESEDFDSKLSQIRLRYKSGTGKKAEVRKARKKPGNSGGSVGVYLPPVPLKEPVSGGLKVDFGFSPYSERINGRIALLGLSALLLVELATGKSTISYHTPSIIFLQVYFVATVSAIFVKLEKEKISVWPKPEVTDK